MGAVRIQHYFDNDQGVRFRVNIWDSDWASAAITTFQANNFELEYETAKNITYPLIPSTVYFQLYNDLSTGANGFMTFISDIANAQEDEFKLYIEKWDGSAYQIYWAGVIQTDICSWKNESPQAEFEIIAKCGIGRLENIYFDKIEGAAYSTEPNTFIEIIKDCLAYSETAQFWNGSSKPYILCSPLWYDTQQTLALQQRLLETVSAAKEFLIDSGNGKVTSNRSDTDPPLKAKTILHDILRMLSLRIFLADGSWHIKQISNADTTYRRAHYNYTGAFNGAKQVAETGFIGPITLSGNAKVTVAAVGLTGTPIILNVAVLSTDTDAQAATKIETAMNANANITAIFTVTRGSNVVVITKKTFDAHDTSMNIKMENGTTTGITTTNSAWTTSGSLGEDLATQIVTENGGTLAVEANGIFEYFPPVKLATADIYPSDIVSRVLAINQSINTAHLTYSGSAINIGTIYGGSKLFLHFNVFYDVLTWHAVLTTFAQIEVKIKLVAGSYRLTNNGAGVGKWTTTAADEFIQVIDFNAVIDGKQNILPFETEEIPFAKESGCTIQITITLQRSTSGTSYPSVTELDTYFKRVEIMLMDYSVDPPSVGQLTRYELENPASSANSVDVEFGTMRMHDTGVISSKNVIEILPTETSASTAWNKSAVWNSGYASNERLIYSALREVIGLQKTSVKKYNGNFRSTIFEPWEHISYDGVVWEFLGGRFDAREAEWNLILFAVGRDTTAVPTSNVLRNHNPALTPYFRWPNFGKPTTTVKNNLPDKGTKNDKTSSGAAMTTLNVDALPNSLLRFGDKLLLLNPVNDGFIGEIYVDSIPDEGDTSFSIQSFSAPADIWPGTVVRHDPDEIVASKLIRAGEKLEIGGNYSGAKVAILKAFTTNATATEATTDGASGSGQTNRVAISDDTSIGCLITVIGKKDSDKLACMFIRQALLTHDVTGGGGTVLNGSVVTVGTDNITDIVGSVSVTANATDNCLKVQVTGVAATNIDWTVKVDYTIITDN